MKVATAFLLFVVSAASQAATQAPYLVSEEDCFGMAMIAKAAALSRDYSVPQEEFIKKVKSPERMRDPGYKAMYPTVEGVVKYVYSDKFSPESHFENQLNRCQRSMIGKPPTI